MRTRNLWLGCALLMAAPIVACSSPGRVAAWEKDPGAAAGTVTATSATASVMAEAEAHWAMRDDKAELRKAIIVWEGIVATSPRDAAALTALSRACYFLADGHLVIEGAPATEEFEAYKKGVDYGERALLVLEPEFEAAMRAEEKFEDAIKKIGKAGMAPAYWYAVNLGRFATKQGLSTRLYYKDKLKATMEQILTLDATFFYGAADRYFGAFYAILPSIAGKDLVKSEEHFDKSLKLAPEYLSTKVVKAQFLAVEKDEEDTYRELLNEVLKGADGDNADIAPENRAAKRTAQKMLNEIEEIF